MIRSTPRTAFRSGRPPSRRNVARGWAASVWLCWVFGAAAMPVGAAEPAPALRLISLNPSLTAIVVRLGAADRLVGVDDYSARVVSEVAHLPRVGGLFDPSLEAVVALRPDRVLVVAGVDQEGHADRLRRAGLRVDVYANERWSQVFENVERLGALLGRERQATTRLREIAAMRRAVARATEGRDRPATIAVVDRSPLYVVGRATFLDEMLEAAGARNLARPLGAGYPRGSIEWLIAARPALLLDMTPDAVAAAAFWARWPSLPAVARGRVVSVEASRVTLPGPDLDRALRELALLVHGRELAPAIDAALESELADAREREG